MTEQLDADATRPPRSSVAPGTSALPAELWQAVLDGWEDPKRHDTLLLHCQTSAELAAAASSYRSMMEDPARQAVAETQLKRIVAAAMAQMQVSRATESHPPRSKLGWQLFVLLALAIGTVLLLRHIALS
jgi:hypothetical protein